MVKRIPEADSRLPDKAQANQLPQRRAHAVATPPVLGARSSGAAAAEESADLASTLGDRKATLAMVEKGVAEKAAARAVGQAGLDNLLDKLKEDVKQKRPPPSMKETWVRLKAAALRVVSGESTAPPGHGGLGAFGEALAMAVLLQLEIVEDPKSPPESAMRAAYLLGRAAPELGLLVGDERLMGEHGETMGMAAREGLRKTYAAEANRRKKATTVEKHAAWQEEADRERLESSRPLSRAEIANRIARKHADKEDPLHGTPSTIRRAINRK